MTQPHFLVVSFPAQGHLNPALQFGKSLVRAGARVTFATCVSAHRRMTKSPTPDGLSFAAFSDGYDDGFDSNKDDTGDYMSTVKRRGSETLAELLRTSENEGRPFTCLVYTLLLAWVGELARDLHLPSALLWLQPALVFDTYYYYFYGFDDYIKEKVNEASCLIELPGLPPLSRRDLPSFFLPETPNTYSTILGSFKEQMERLVEEGNPRILVNTFNALEPETLTAIDKFNMIAVGPLIPSAFLDGKDPSDTSFGCDLFKSSEDYIEWLNSKPKSSVIYVSFGSLCVLAKQQMEEIAKGLLDSGHPFLWVIREKEKQKDKEKEEDELINYRKELNEKGMIVPWCSQVQVLSHASLGCFITHCGWNSTLESLVSGVPVVAFPQWTDQGTNAKIIEDISRTGVRVKANEKGIVESEEIKRCLELVMGEGEKREELRRNVKKWKDLALEAAKQGGSSDKNLKAFVDEVAGFRS
ncbi:Glycosyltransferase [Melia azedarach]|uniref:Glycosyltransferase n=1 Tax=Melia azedarach TaxID=155640 RepID=A0ACC1YGX4_MELAZ|nr:Glycosyltransferase [Melia azedarach]